MESKKRRKNQQQESRLNPAMSSDADDPGTNGDEVKQYQNGRHQQKETEKTAEVINSDSMMESSRIDGTVEEFDETADGLGPPESPLNIEKLRFENNTFVQRGAQGGGGRAFERASVIAGIPTESTTLLRKDEQGIVERRYSWSEVYEETDNLRLPLDLERGQSLPTVEAGSSGIIGDPQGHGTSYLGKTITDLAQSSYIEDTITSATDFFLGVWTVQGHESEDEEPSNQGLLREIIASFNRLFESIGGGAVYGWNHSSDFFMYTWEIIEEKTKSIEPQGWMNILFSSFIAVLVASLIAQSNYMSSYRQSTDLTILQLNEVVQNMQTAQGQYQAVISQKVIHLTGIINDLRDDLSYVKNNETSTAALNVKFANFQTDVNNQIISNNAYVSQQVDTATNNVSVNIEAMKAFVEGDLDNYRQEFYSESGLFAREMKAAKNSTQSEIDAMNRLMTKVQKKMAGYQSDTNNEFLGETNFVKFQLAGTFMLLACLCSGWHLGQHRTNLKNIEAQKRVMAILWMVPIYSVTSWMSLVSEIAAPYAGAVRDCYEAYAIYTFVALLVAVMEDGKGLSALVERLSEQVRSEIQDEQEAIKSETEPPARHLLPPFPCGYARSKPYSIASTWIFQCKLLAMQFVLLNPLLAVSPLILGMFGVNVNAPSTNVDGSINWYSLQLWCAILQNVSICVAFWGLWVFYHGTIQELEWCNPWPKFLCIKGIVFMTYYQAIVIDILSAMGSFSMSAANSYQNLLICIEMFLFAIAHVYIFPVDEWEQGYKEKREALKKEEKRIRFGDTFAMPEFFSDVRQIVTVEDFYLKGKEEKALEYTKDDYDESGNLIAQEEESSCYSCSCFGSSERRKDGYLSAPDSPIENVVVGTVTLSHRKVNWKIGFESTDKGESEKNESGADHTDKDDLLEFTPIERINSRDLIGVCPVPQQSSDENIDTMTINWSEIPSNINTVRRSMAQSSNVNLTNGASLPQKISIQSTKQRSNRDYFSPHSENIESFWSLHGASNDTPSATFISSNGEDPSLPLQTPVDDWKLVSSRESSESSMNSSSPLESERLHSTMEDSFTKHQCSVHSADKFRLRSNSIMKNIEGNESGARLVDLRNNSTLIFSDFERKEMGRDDPNVDAVDSCLEKSAWDSSEANNVDHGATVPEIVVSHGKSSSIIAEQVNTEIGKGYIKEEDDDKGRDEN